MPPRLTLFSRSFRVHRAVHTTRPALTSDSDLPPELKTAADLGFTKNVGRVRDFSKLDIPTSSLSNIQPNRETSHGPGTRRKALNISPTRDQGENQQASRRKQQQGVAADKHTPEPDSTISTSPMSGDIANEFSQPSEPPEAKGVTPSRPRKIPLERVDVDLSGDLLPLASSNSDARTKPGSRPPRRDSQAGTIPGRDTRAGTTSLRGDSQVGMVPRRDTQAGTSRLPRRDLLPGASAAARGPRRDLPPQARRPSPRPSLSLSSRPRSARPPRRDSSREAKPSVRRRESQPAPPPAKVDHSWNAMFGRESMVSPVPARGGDVGMEIWAQGMDKAEARRHSTLSLAGAYSHVLPKVPFPSDPSVASKPAERAKSTVAWSQALNQSCSLSAAKFGEEVVARFLP